MTYQSDFEGLLGWDYAVIVACLGGFLILGLLVRCDVMKFNMYYLVRFVSSISSEENTLNILEDFLLPNSTLCLSVSDAQDEMRLLFPDFPSRGQEVARGVFPLGQEHALPPGNGIRVANLFPILVGKFEIALDRGLSIRLQHRCSALYRTGGVGSINRN